MIDYEKIEKAKEIWGHVDDFDKKWLSTRGVFNIMHKVGVLDDEDHQEILQHYDRMMAPITKATDELKARAIAKVTKVAWNYVADSKKDQ